MNKTVHPFDWHRILISEETDLDYLPEVIVRTLIMFVFLLFMLKFLSKRGVKQLSIFELAILIALGSATGDPMFYNHVPLIHGFLVLLVVIFVYRFITHLTGKSNYLEVLLEGQPIILLKHGRIVYPNYEKVKLPYDKFFAELRLKSVDHLGQVDRVYLETSGEMSIYLAKKEEQKDGLPIYPEIIKAALSRIRHKATYACIHCGDVQDLEPKDSHKCQICGLDKWVPACKA
jgi:uncharacterized membrane protein YcaP (DUF421 family)